MPAAGLYTTKEIQDFLMSEIQAPIVRNFTILRRGGTFFQIIRAIIELIQVARKIKKIPRPEHNNVVKYNQHVLIDLRDNFLAHDASDGVRHEVFEGMFNFVIIKYGFDDYMSKRLDYFFWIWQRADWFFTRKHPATDWILNEEDKQEPTYQRQEALKEALDNKEWSKVLSLID